MRYQENKRCTSKQMRKENAHFRTPLGHALNKNANTGNSDFSKHVWSVERNLESPKMQRAVKRAGASMSTCKPSLPFPELGR